MNNLKGCFGCFGVLFVFAFLIGGCSLLFGGNETDKAPEPVTQSKVKQETVVEKKDLDFSKINEAVRDFTLKQHEMVRDVYVGLAEDDNKRIAISIVVNPATNDKELLEILDTVIRRTNAEAQMQDSSIASSGGQRNDWGGLYDKYGTFIVVSDTTEKVLVMEATETNTYKTKKIKVNR